MKERIFLFGLLIVLLAGVTACGNGRSLRDLREIKETVHEEEAVTENPTTDILEASIVDAQEESTVGRSEEADTEETVEMETEESPEGQEDQAEKHITAKIAEQYIDIIEPFDEAEYDFSLVFVRDTKYPQLAVLPLPIYDEDTAKVFRLYQPDNEGNVELIADYYEILDSIDTLDGYDFASYYERKDIIVLYTSFLGDQVVLSNEYICRADGTEIGYPEAQKMRNEAHEEFFGHAYPYGRYTKEQILQYLNMFRSSDHAGGGPEGPWKTVYRDFLYDLLAGIEYIGGEACYTGRGMIFFSLYDITDDGIPELWVSGNEDEKYRFWDIYTVVRDNERVLFLPDDSAGYATVFDPDNRQLYVDSSYISNQYELYSIEDGRAVMQYEVRRDEEEGRCYLRYSNDEDTDITINEYNEYLNSYNEAKEKYCGLMDVFEVNGENIERELAKWAP